MRRKGVGLSDLVRIGGLSNRQSALRYRDGERKLPLDIAQRLAGVLDTTADALLLLPELPEAKVAGSVGAGGSIIDVNDEDFSENVRRVAVIAGELAGAAAAEVKGDSLGELFDGWYVLYGPQDAAHDGLFGRLCVVRTKDGETAVKWVKRAKSRRKETVDLFSGNGDLYREAVLLDWAAPVLGMRPK